MSHKGIKPIMIESFRGAYLVYNLNSWCTRVLKKDDCEVFCIHIARALEFNFIDNHNAFLFLVYGISY